MRTIPPSIKPTHRRPSVFNVKKELPMGLILVDVRIKTAISNRWLGSLHTLWLKQY